MVVCIGTPLTELQRIPIPPTKVRPPMKPSTELQNKNMVRSDGEQSSDSPGTILFVRNRMFYARAALNAKGKVRFGLCHIRECRL